MSPDALITRSEVKALLTKEGIPCYNSKFKDFIDAGLLPKVKVPAGIYAKYRLADVNSLIAMTKPTS